MEGYVQQSAISHKLYSASSGIQTQVKAKRNYIYPKYRDTLIITKLLLKFEQVNYR